MSYDFELNKNQNKRTKDPQMQNFMSFGPLGAELQHPSYWSSHTLLSPFRSLETRNKTMFVNIVVCYLIKTNLVTGHRLRCQVPAMAAYYNG